MTNAKFNHIRKTQTDYTGDEEKYISLDINTEEDIKIIKKKVKNFLEKILNLKKRIRFNINVDEDDHFPLINSCFEINSFFMTNFNSLIENILSCCLNSGKFLKKTGGLSCFKAILTSIPS